MLLAPQKSWAGQVTSILNVWPTAYVARPLIISCVKLHIIQA